MDNCFIGGNLGYTLRKEVERMAFSDFKTIPEVLEKFRITYTVKDFVQIEELPDTPSEQFLQEFEFCLQHIDVFASEAARCEAIIFPILKEIYKPYAGRLCTLDKESHQLR